MPFCVGVDVGLTLQPRLKDVDPFMGLSDREKRPEQQVLDAAKWHEASLPCLTLARFEGGKILMNDIKL